MLPNIAERTKLSMLINPFWTSVVCLQVRIPYIMHLDLYIWHPVLVSHRFSLSARAALSAVSLVVYCIFLTNSNCITSAVLLLHTPVATSYQASNVREVHSVGRCGNA